MPGRRGTRTFAAACPGRRNTYLATRVIVETVIHYGETADIPVWRRSFSAKAPGAQEKLEQLLSVGETGVATQAP